MTAVPEAPIQPGQVLRGKYRIDRVLGRGGMGEVFEAFHLDLERRVAVKVLLPELRTHAEIVGRFLREGKAASRIEGDHVARVLDVDRLADGTPFLVMEYLDGSDLSSVRRSGVPLAVGDAAVYVLQACSALAQAHARGVIHRDVKPANLFLARHHDGSLKVKVLDFGISKIASAIGASDPGMTRATAVMGSAEYMSPEQMLSSRDVDVRTDVWALGVTLFELLTVRVPFPGSTVTEVCAQVMTRPPPPPRSLRPEIPEAVERVILRCLEKDPAQRFASAAALADALRAAIAPSVRPDAAPPHTSPPRPSPPPHALDAAPAVAQAAGATSALHGERTSLLPEEALPGVAAPVAASPALASIRGGGTAVSAAPLPSLTGGSTHVPVSSEPIPSPPRRSAAPVVLGGILLLALVGIALGVRATSGGAPAATLQAGSSSHGTSTPASSPAGAPSVALDVPAPPEVRVTPAAGASPVVSSSSLPRATALPSARRAPTAPGPSQRPAPSAEPVPAAPPAPSARISGID